jgi:hypothetical protein
MRRCGNPEGIVHMDYLPMVALTYARVYPLE